MRIRSTVLFLALAALPGGLHAQAARRSLGLTMQGAGNRIFILQVDDGGPADRAGLKARDEIQSIAGISVTRLDPKVLRVIVDTAKVVKFVIWRDGKKMVLSVQPGMYAPPRPKPPTQPMDEPRGGRRQT